MDEDRNNLNPPTPNDGQPLSPQDGSQPTEPRDSRPLPPQPAGYRPPDYAQSEVDDAFGFRPEQPATGYNPYAPTPQMNYEKAKRSDTSMRILYIALAVFVAAALFVGGFFTHYATVSDEARVMDWMFETIRDHYVGDDVDGENFTIQDYLDAAGKGLTYPYGPLDRYSSFYTPHDLEELIEEQAGNNSDYGFAATMGKRLIYDDAGNQTQVDAIVVHYVVGNSPAEKAGVLAEDVFYKIAGNEVKCSTNEEIQDTFYAPTNTTENVDFVFLRPVYVAERQRIEYIEVPVSFQSQEYDAKYVKYYEREAKDGAKALPQLAADTAYLKYAQFEGKSAAEFAAAMELFKSHDKSKLILDLRGNGGGYLDICVQLCNYLVTDSGNGKGLTIATTEFKQGKGESYQTTENKYKNMGFDKIVVLTDSGTASASEVLLGAMRDYGTVDAIIGDNTYGKGIMQSRFTKTYKKQTYALVITVARWYTPQGNWVHKRTDGAGNVIAGTIQPTSRVLRSETNYPYSFEGDAELAAAIAFLR